jgi:hypothetical protein
MTKSLMGSCLLVLGLMTGCEPQFGPSDSGGDHPNIRYDYVTELVGGIVPDSGVYYTYRFSDYRDHLDQPVILLDALLDAGCPVTAAWYQGGGYCDTTYGNWGTNTIYMPVFIVRLHEANAKMEDFKFTLQGARIPYICRYRVTVFTISD